MRSVLHASAVGGAAFERKRSGSILSAADHTLTGFTVADLFAEPEVRRRSIVVFAMSLATTLAWWSISSFVPTFVGEIAGKAGLCPAAMGHLWSTYLQLRRFPRFCCPRLPRRSVWPQASHADLFRCGLRLDACAVRVHQ
jgi:hypothetical protein